MSLFSRGAGVLKQQSLVQEQQEHNDAVTTHTGSNATSTSISKRSKVGKASALSLLLIFLTSLLLVLHNNYLTNSTISRTSSTTPIVSSSSTTTSQRHHDTRATPLSFAASRAKRMKFYKDRYKYTPPTPYIQHTKRDELCGNYPDFDTYFHMPTVGVRKDPQRSANDEDKTIYNLFFKNPNPTIDQTSSSPAPEIGNVVEMGAFNGIQESNSRFFETCLGWNTLLVEGNPLLWEQVLENRPHAHKFSFAPSCSEEEEMANKTVQFDRYPMTNAGVHQGNVTTAYTYRQWFVDVPCGSLTKVLLDIFPNGHVTFFSLDVEGAEPLVVGNIDFDKVFIEIMMIENRNKFCPNDSCESRKQFRKIMLDAGYVLFYNNRVPIVEKSDLFIHPLSEHLKTIRKKTGKKGITKSDF